MPYYSAGDYYTGDYYRGDNYATGGIFSSIGKFLGGAAKTVLGATPVGRVVGTALIPSLGAPQIAGLAPGRIMPTPGLRGTAQRLFPGGASGYELGRRRRMNPLNVKALRRAGRRVKGFLKIASRLGALPVHRGKGKRLFKAKRRAA
jgi:hypothetical protein